MVFVQPGPKWRLDFVHGEIMNRNIIQAAKKTIQKIVMKQIRQQKTHLLKMDI